MKSINFFPQFLRDSNRYPFISATSEVTDLVIAMYYRELADSIKYLYSLDSDYYSENIRKFGRRSELSKENLDKLVETFLPFASSFINQTSYDNKRGILSFTDAFFAMKGTQDGLFSLFNFLGIPVTIYTKEKTFGRQNMFNTYGQVQLEKLGGPSCVSETEKAEQDEGTRIVYEYTEAKYEILYGDRLYNVPDANGVFGIKDYVGTKTINSTIDIIGYFKVEAGKDYSFIICSDDGSRLDVGENGKYGSCWVPCDSATDSSNVLALWSNEDSWIAPATGNVQGHPFCWANRWVEFKAKEDGYIPLRIRKGIERGGGFGFKVVGGERNAVRASIQSSYNNNPLDYETLPKFPARLMNNGDVYIPQNIIDRTDTVCSYFETSSFFTRTPKYMDPAGLLEEYDIVVSINLTDDKNILDIDKANQDSWKYYGKSLQKRIEELVKEFTWICSDVIAYLYYACQDTVNVRDSVSSVVKYKFRELTSDASVRRAMVPVFSDKSSSTVQRVKPPAGLYAPSGQNKIKFSYLTKDGAFIGSNTKFEDTKRYVSVSSVVGENVPTGDDRSDTDDQKLRVVLRPREATGIYSDGEKRLLVFAKGGVFTGTNSAWYLSTSNADVKNWVTKDQYKGGRELISGTDKLEKYAIVTSNNAVNETSILPTSTSVSGETYYFSGSQASYPRNVLVRDKLKITKVSR